MQCAEDLVAGLVGRVLQPRAPTRAAQPEVAQCRTTERALHGHLLRPAAAPDDHRPQRSGRTVGPERELSAARPTGVTGVAAVHPCPVGKVVEMTVGTGHHEARRDEILLARRTFGLAGRRVETEERLERTALGARVHEWETPGAHTVTSSVGIGCRGQAEAVHSECPGQPGFGDPGSFGDVPGVDARDDERLVLNGDHGADPVGADELGAADLTEATCGPNGRATGASAADAGRERGRGRGHRVASRKREDEASTSRRLHRVGHPELRPSVSSKPLRRAGTGLLRRDS